MNIQFNQDDFENLGDNLQDKKWFIPLSKLILKLTPPKDDLKMQRSIYISLREYVHRLILKKTPIFYSFWFTAILEKIKYGELINASFTREFSKGLAFIYKNKPLSKSYCNLAQRFSAVSCLVFANEIILFLLERISDWSSDEKEIENTRNILAFSIACKNIGILSCVPLAFPDSKHSIWNAELLNYSGANIVVPEFIFYHRDTKKTIESLIEVLKFGPFILLENNLEILRRRAFRYEAMSQIKQV